MKSAHLLRSGRACARRIAAAAARSVIGRAGRPTAAALLALSAALSTLAACTTAEVTSGGPGSTSGEPPVGPVPVVRTDADIVLPVDSMLATTEQMGRVSLATDVLVRECLKRFGKDWPIMPPTGGLPVARNARRYTIVDRAKVAVEGYHPVDLLKAEEAARQRSAGQPPVPQDVRDLWLGSTATAGDRPAPVGGCAGEADRRLHAGVDLTGVGLPQRLTQESFERTRVDSRVRASFARWSACMRGKGYRYRDPFAAFNDPRWGGPQISTGEITTAIADVTCKTKENVAGVMLAVETAYQRRMTDEHAARLTAIKAALAAELANANRILADAGPLPTG
jgi:hypothetical protein